MSGERGKVEKFLSAHPVFSRKEFRELVSPRQPNSSADSLLKYHVSTGRVVHAAPAVYAAVPPHLDPSTFRPDRLLVASRIRGDGVLALHTALELHGLAYSDFSETHVLSNGRPGELTTLVGPVRFIAQPAALRREGKELEETVVLDRRGLDVRATTPERTLVDCVDHPGLAGGVEEIARALQSVKAIDVDRLVGHVRNRENMTLAGVLGSWLESRKDDLFVDQAALAELRLLSPPVPRTALGADSRHGEFIPGWNVMLPKDFLRPDFEGMQHGMTP